MNAHDTRIEQLLIALKADGRSSPRDWQGFHLFLTAKKQASHSNPPVPLILAASGASDATKHRRLADQLRWADDNGCLDDAIHYLSELSAEEWQSCPLEHWNQDSYPS